MVFPGKMKIVALFALLAFANQRVVAFGCQTAGCNDTKLVCQVGGYPDASGNMKACSSSSTPTAPYDKTSTCVAGVAKSLCGPNVCTTKKHHCLTRKFANGVISAYGCYPNVAKSGTKNWWKKQCTDSATCSNDGAAWITDNTACSTSGAIGHSAHYVRAAALMGVMSVILTHNGF